MVHLAPLPGSPACQQPLDRTISDACRDAATLTGAGFDALIVENFGDAPFRAAVVDPHTVACMTLVARRLRAQTDLPLGINVLRNDARAALAVAIACDAAFIRVNVHTGVYATDQGIIEGRADDTLRYRQLIGSRAAVPDRPLFVGSGANTETIRALLGIADGVIVGTAIKQDGKTTAPVDLDRAWALVAAANP